MASDRLPERTIRVSDADRQAVLNDLAHHVGEGRLTLLEYEERVAAALDAMTNRDLQVVLEDLPAPAQAGVTADRPRLVWTIVGGLKQQFNGPLPARMRVATVLGSSKLDLRGAVIDRDVTVVVTSVVGSIKVRVPPNVRVEVSGFSVVGSRNLPAPSPRAGSQRVLHLRCSSVVGSVHIRS